MILDLIWVTGTVLSVVVLLAGACLALLETEPFLSLRGRKSAVPRALLARDLWFMDSHGVPGPHVHYLSGSDAADAQLRSLFGDAMNVRAAIISGRSADEVAATIDVFVRDLARHFQDEEWDFEAARYPSGADHAALHQALLASIRTQLGQYRAGTRDVGELFRCMAHDVFDMHTVTADAMWSRYLDIRLEEARAIPGHSA